MKSAVAISEEFRQYAYSVSHDVSAPVRAMVEFSKLLLEENADALSADGQEYLSLIVENGRKLQAMMEGLLQYSRLNTRQAPFTNVEIKPLVDGVISGFGTTIMHAGATVQADKLPAVIKADAEHIKQLFHALIDNALKFQPPGNAPVVRISSRQTPDGLELTVADNGIGIAPAHRDSVFQPFKRLHTDAEYPGIGMGLTLAGKITERHGGTISCADNTPCGSVFTITLPIQEA